MRFPNITSLRRSLILCSALFFATAPAAESLWRGERGASQFGKEMTLANQLATQAAELHSTSRSQARGTASNAVDAYKKASALAPLDPEPHYRIAEVLYAHFLSPRTERTHTLAHLALKHWDTFAKLAPLDPRATEFLHRRSLVLTTLATPERYLAALKDYETLITRGHAVGNYQAAHILGNMAELYMMRNELGSAIDHYQQALNYRKIMFHQIGYAVALDRDGQIDKARAVLNITPGQLNAFENDIKAGNGFFVPSGEGYYYYALANEVLGNANKAVVNYQRFIRSGAYPVYHPRARENIAALRRNTAKKRKPRNTR